MVGCTKTSNSLLRNRRIPIDYVAHSQNDLKQSYPQAAWRLLGRLNAGRIANRKQEEMRDYLEIASSMPFSDAYPILSWVIGNAVSRFADTDQANSILRPMFEATLLSSQIASRFGDQNSRILRDTLVRGKGTKSHGEVAVIRAGERELALSRLRLWIEQKVEGYLLICDPFFGPGDLEAMKLILEVKPGTKVRVLTSAKHQMQEGVAQPYQESYISYWRTRISDQDPPDTEIVIVGTQTSRDSPIHDRWWLTRAAGLRMGTSFGSLGVGKDSELSEISPDSVPSYEANVNRYIQRETREYNGERLSYTTFTLD
jgi:hypothetical protein